MKKNIWLIPLLIICIIILIFSGFGKSEGVVYDCSLAEISPDYPFEVKQECRRLRYEMWRKEQEESRRKTMI